jgi:hypothetical protein
VLGRLLAPQEFGDLPMPSEDAALVVHGQCSTWVSKVGVARIEGAGEVAEAASRNVYSVSCSGNQVRPKSSLT